jgi:hypothetical protein
MLKYNIKNENLSTNIFFNDYDTVNKPYIENIKIILESNKNLNIYPDDTNINYTYKNITNYVYNFVVNTNFLCKGLYPEYIKDSFDDSDAIIVLSSKGVNLLPNGNVYGFALIIFNDVANSIYIDVICSHNGIKYAGDSLMKSINEISKTLFINKIELKSVSYAISFYEKYGFIKSKLCKDDGNLCEMFKIMQNKTYGGKKKYGGIRKINKTKKGLKMKIKKFRKTKRRITKN